MINDTQHNRLDPHTGLSRNVLSLTVTRHGPKNGLDGELSDEGKIWVKKHYQKSLEQNKIDYKVPRKVYCSPKNRCRQTAQLYEQVCKQYASEIDLKIFEEEKLSEKNLIDFINSLSENQRNDWFRHWYLALERPTAAIMIGKDAVKDFSHWLVELVYDSNNSDQNITIDAFSHGPVMAAFVLRLEDQIKMQLLPAPMPGKDRLDFEKLFAEKDGDFHYLSSFSIHIPESAPEIMHLTIKNKLFKVPLTAVYDLTK